MNRDVDTFRALLLLSAFTLAAAVFLTYAGMPVTPEQQPFLAGQGAGALAGPNASEYMFLSWLAIYVCAHLLAYFLSWLAKAAFLISFVILVLLPTVSGLSVGTPWDNTAWAFHEFAATFAIGMLFFSPGIRSATRLDVARSQTAP